MVGASSCLYIGDLDKSIDDEKLRLMFSATKHVVTAKVSRDKITGESAGFGFIEFTTKTAAEGVYHTFNGKPIPGYPGKFFKLNWASFGLTGGDMSDRPGVAKTVPAEQVIFAMDLAPDVDDFILKNCFASNYRTVKSAQVILDPISQASKGFGFVMFGSQDEVAQAVVEMNGKNLLGRPLRLRTASVHFVGPTALDIISSIDPNNSTIFVGGLTDPTITDEELKGYFLPFGEVTNSKVVIAKSCGFVTFRTHESAFDAIAKMTGSRFKGCVLRLSWGRGTTTTLPPPSGPPAYLPGQAPVDPSMAYSYYGYYGAYPQMAGAAAPQYGYIQQPAAPAPAAPTQAVAPAPAMPQMQAAAPVPAMAQMQTAAPPPVHVDPSTSQYSMPEATGTEEEQEESRARKPKRRRKEEENFTMPPDYEEESAVYIEDFSEEPTTCSVSMLALENGLSNDFIDSKTDDLAVS